MDRVIDKKVLPIIPLYKNEKQLIAEAAKGHREAQHRLYTKYAPTMLGVCRRYIGDLQFAEDVLVKGFVKVFNSIKDFSNRGSFEGWVRRIMINESISHLRKQQFVVYDGEVLDRVGEVSYHQENSMDADYIQNIIDELPAGYKMVFVLFAIEGYPHSEIAEMLDISENTSKSQLFKARRMLQEKLKEQNIIGYGTE